MQEDTLAASEKHPRGTKRSRLDTQDDTLTTDQAAAMASTSTEAGEAAADMPLTETLRVSIQPTAHVVPCACCQLQQYNMVRTSTSHNS